MLDAYFLGILYAVGLIAAYEDIKKGKISNSLILIGLLAGCLVYLWPAALAVLSPPVNYAYFKQFLLNISLSWLLSYFIWYAGLWSAGDAKIFMLFVFLLPLDYYGASRLVPFFPAFNLLANIFILTLFIIVSGIILNIIRASLEEIFNSTQKRRDAKKTAHFLILEQWLHKIKQIKNDGIYFKIFLVYLCFFILIDIVRGYAGDSSALRGFISLAMVIAFRPLRRFIGKIRSGSLYLLLAALSIYKFAFMHTQFKVFFIYLAVMLVNCGIFMAVFFVIFGLIEVYLKTKEEIRISPNGLSAGMILSRDTLNFIEQAFRKEGIEEKFYADGLTSGQVQRVKDELFKKNIGEISIYKTFPFVPFVLAGVIATAVSRGGIFDFEKFTSVFKMLFGK